ncbi:MAG: glycosyltransferase [Eubacteriales bacterium]|nr:glycosyltransferase [Eubacteriales bacterium]
MKVAVVTDLHFVEDRDGNSFTPVMYGYPFFQRYHNVFEEVYVVARGRKVEHANKNALQINGEGVNTWMLPETYGIKQYMKKHGTIRKSLIDIIGQCDTVIIRTPSALSSMAVFIARKLHKKFALEVVADPYSIKPGKSMLDRILNSYLVKQCKDACMAANGVAYVTKYFLQTVCPCKCIAMGYETDEYFTGNYSSITLMETFFAEPKTYTEKKRFVISHTANLIQNEAKGHDVVIKTVALLRQMGYDVSAIFIGDGSAVEHFKKMASSLDVADYIHFVGKFSDPMLVREQLLASDLYLFPSESEGLPRGVIEAMACGLVVVASNVSGIPELLDDEDMREPHDVDGYVRRISTLLNEPELMKQKSVRNIEIARLYQNDNLTRNRNAFYGKLKKLVESGD